MRLILCGGGHVSLELAHIAQRLDFEVTVIDDRPEFANEERFPMAHRVLALPFPEALEALGSREDDFYCVLTRGHTYDRDCLARILRGSYAYAGMIGSRRKVSAVMEALAEQGFSPRQLAAVHAPIGLLLGGQTPAEVAVEIAAELVQERAKLGPGLTSPPKRPGILCVITAKSGSAPRGEGAWMLVEPDGRSTGTIGGGATEHQALQDALELWAGGGAQAEKTYDLTGLDPAMICGGKITVRFQRQNT